MQQDVQAQQLWKAIDALYGQSPAEQQAAGNWLNDFSDQPEAPQAALGLLQATYPPQIQFFAANMLLTAVKRRWSRTEPQLREKIVRKLSYELDIRRTDAAALEWKALQRLILAFASIAVSTGSEMLTSTVGKAISVASQGSLMTSLELLAAVAEAGDAVQRRLRGLVIESLQASVDEVFAVILHSLKDSTGPDAQHRAALTALSAWLHLDPTEANDALMSPGALRNTQRELFGAVVEHMSHPDDKTAAEATEIIVFLLSCWATSDNASAEAAAIQDVAAAVVRQRGASESIEEEKLHNLAKVSASLANRDTSAVAARLPEAVPIAAIMLEALGSRHRGACEAAIDYFDLLSAVPVALRNPQLGKPVFAAMVPNLARVASYPVPFTSWEECTSEDHDTFHSFRDHVLSDALDTCQKLLQLEYLEHCWQALGAATTWQSGEAAVFALRQYRRKAQCLTYNQTSATGEDTILSAIFSHLTHMDGPVRESLYFRDSALHLMTGNSAWLASAPEQLLEAVIGVILASLRLQPCSHSAASAFNYLCSSMPASRALSLYSPLLSTIMPILQLPGQEAPSWEDRAELVSGLVRLIGLSGPKGQQIMTAAQQMVLPFAQQAEDLALSLQQGSIEKAHAEDAVSGTLTLLCRAFSRLEFCALEGGTPQLVAAVMAAVMPHLDSLSCQGVARTAPAVTSALCQVFKRCLLAMDSAVEGVVKQVVVALGRVFPGEPQACIEVLTTAVDISEDLPADLAILGDTISQLAVAISPALQAADLNPDLAAAWFILLAHCRIDDPSEKRKPLVCKITDFVPRHFTLALGCLRRQEEDLIRALVAFLRSSLGVDNSNPDNIGVACMQAHGDTCVRELVRALAISCPPKILRALALLLQSTLNHKVFGSASRAAFAAVMAQDEALAGVLDLMQRQKICSTALNMSPTSAGLFAALMKDMSSIARSEVDADVLLSYELLPVD